MNETDSKRSFGARFGRAIGGLVLALLNATLLLFIVAAVAGIVLVGKVRHLATDVAGDIARGAVASTGLDPADTLSELRVVSTEMADLRAAIVERGGDVDERVQALEARLDSVQAKIDTLRDRKALLTDAMIDKASVAAGTALKGLRDCRPAEAGS